MPSKPWSTPAWHSTGQALGPRRRSALGLLILGLTVQVALGCRATPLPPAPSPTLAPAATPTATQPPATLPASPSPSLLPPTGTPAPTRPPTVAPTEKAPADPAASLASLQRVDDYPLYTMRYYGSYPLEASQEEGPRWATTGKPPSNWGCSLFAALGDAQRRLYGRNFDWRYSPALLLYTDPPDGYASASMVDVAYLVDPNDVQMLTDLPLEQREPLLEAPLWPFDGMNEHGLVVGMAAVPKIEMPYEPDRATIDSLGVIRKMLDHARDVGEAVAILGRYNITWDGGPPLHYLIADAAGGSVLVEFYAGEMVLIPRPGGSPWHVATNHLRVPLDDGDASGCWRYDTIRGQLAYADGSLTLSDAVNLLAEVAQENTQWSVVYDMSDGVVHVAMGRAYERMHRFGLSR